MELNEKPVEEEMNEQKTTDADEKLKEAAKDWADKADKWEESAKEQLAEVVNAFSGTADKLAEVASEKVAGAATVLAGLADKFLDSLSNKGAEQTECHENAETASETPVQETEDPTVTSEPVDFSNVEIEPLFEETVDFDTFSKSDFRAVKVKDCIAVPKSKKLLQFTLDDGTGTDRTILSGIHAFYEPEQLIGKTLIAITNLPPRKMMGIDSCGMLLSAIHNVNGEEKLNLLIVDDSIPAGAKLY